MMYFSLKRYLGKTVSITFCPVVNQGFIIKQTTLPVELDFKSQLVVSWQLFQRFLSLWSFQKILNLGLVEATVLSQEAC